MKYGWIMPFASFSFPLVRLAPPLSLSSGALRTSTCRKPAQCARIFVSSTFVFQQRLKLAEFDKNVSHLKDFYFAHKNSDDGEKSFPLRDAMIFTFFRFFVFGFIFHTCSCRDECVCIRLIRWWHNLINFVASFFTQNKIPTITRFHNFIARRAKSGRNIFATRLLRFFEKRIFHWNATMGSRSERNFNEFKSYRIDIHF